MKIFHKYIFTALAATLLAACSESLTDEEPHTADRINLSGDIEQMAVTRVNDNGFCDGDRIGVYIVDYNGNTPGTLLASGNHADNDMLTYSEAAGKWKPAYDLYWNDKHTHIDIYGYYPYAEPDDVDDYKFEVRRDQSATASDGNLGGYEASDFLWGKVADVPPTSSVIRLPMRHRMACARVTLLEGNGFDDGEWDRTEKSVLVANLARKASISLADGSVKADGHVEPTATVPSKTGNEWRAIVVPQTVAGGTTLFSITVGGQPFKFARNDNFTYTQGKMNNFTIRVDKKLPEGTYALTLVSQSITPWENDLVSHDATAREYIVVNSSPGHLKDSIEAARLNYTSIKNLKVTGAINASDFYFMCDSMTLLQAINLKEVRIKGVSADKIPTNAFKGKKSLTRVVLPDSLKAISQDAFSSCTSLTGTLILPEGVTTIGRNAFAETNIQSIPRWPSSLQVIDYTAFYDCDLSGNLVLPNGLKKIGSSAFAECKNLYGDLRLPESLQSLGDWGTFNDCSGLTGSLTIPQKVTTIPRDAFRDCGFNGTLTLHDGITAIGTAAFADCHFKGELRLPKSLTLIDVVAFSNNDFSSVVLPPDLNVIEHGAFQGNDRLKGTLVIPENVSVIKKQAFLSCSSLEGIVLPENIETIGSEAFSGCTGLGSIVCQGEVPPTISDDTFNGVAKNNFTVEVPEVSVPQYQVATGWKDFKRISAHHELVCRPSAVRTLNAAHKQTLTLNAEGDWEVADKPEWCHVTPSSGSKKTQITITVDQLAKGAGDRTGEITFRLKGNDYTTKCKVGQYDYQYGEDEWVTLQKAHKGKNGGINIVIIGDGYDAKDIASGDYLKTVKQQAEYFFAIEPYKTYRQYFNVYTAIPLSEESGVGTENTIVNNRFSTIYSGSSGLKADYDAIFNYCLGAPTVTKDNLSKTLVIVVPNSTDYGGHTQLWADGSAISFCPVTTNAYPTDTRGIVQHEAGGHGFGKLADEYIYVNDFIDDISASAIKSAKSLGWYDNISLTGRMNAVPWSNLIYDPRYSDVVDIYEGGFGFTRGVFRSELNSCMNNDIPYFSAISRESIVRRIKSYAGEAFSFDDFVAYDNREAAAAKTRAYGSQTKVDAHSSQAAPTIHRGSPLKNRAVRRHR